MSVRLGGRVELPKGMNDMVWNDHPLLLEQKPLPRGGGAESASLISGELFVVFCIFVG